MIIEFSINPTGGQVKGYQLQFADEETKGQRRAGTCSVTPSQRVLQLELELGTLAS